MYELDLDILKMYLRTQNKVSRSSFSKLSTNGTDTERDRQTGPNALPAAFIKMIASNRELSSVEDSTQCSRPMERGRLRLGHGHIMTGY